MACRRMAESSIAQAENGERTAIEVETALDELRKQNTKRHWWQDKPECIGYDISQERLAALRFSVSMCRGSYRDWEREAMLLGREPERVFQLTKDDVRYYGLIQP